MKSLENITNGYYCLNSISYNTRRTSVCRKTRDDTRAVSTTNECNRSPSVTTRVVPGRTGLGERHVPGVAAVLLAAAATATPVPSTRPISLLCAKTSVRPSGVQLAATRTHNTQPTAVPPSARIRGGNRGGDTGDRDARTTATRTVPKTTDIGRIARYHAHVVVRNRPPRAVIRPTHRRVARTRVIGRSRLFEFPPVRFTHILRDTVTVCTVRKRTKT